ncbi:alpha/beta hydrolase [Allopusillimonas ginsengisoli]|nr:alpha/beta hydrolase [Allopusillimonas ginsengisoli]
MGYPADELDRQYNARASVPDCLPFLQEYAEFSAQARTRVKGYLSVAYGDHPDETLDIFPAPQAGAPVYFFVHGGYWRALSKEDSSFMAPMFTQAGATVVAINYSLAPSVSLARIIDQCRRALAWAWRNIATYNGDPARIHASGSSAGGHLVGMLLAGDWHAQYDAPPDILQSASPLSGLFDLRPLVHTHINEWAHLDEATAIDASPVFHLPEQGCPLLVAWGEHETSEFKRQSQYFGQAWQDCGFPVTLAEIPGVNHFNILMQLRRNDTALSLGILGLMGL